MSKSNSFESELLAHAFQNAAIADVGDASGLPAAATAGSLYIALHTADPGETGNQSTNECAYTSYTRIAVARSGAGWTVSGTTPTNVTNAAVITFPQCTGNTETATHFSVGKETSGATDILYKGALTASLAISNGVQPQFSAGDLDVNED